ncbi:MAG TPA: hypothetical protein ENJ08_08975, partial [Gammaproteobacteria bacterium]|nr:hypothetical protein [Gammaproteobacteria bacterium]
MNIRSFWQVTRFVILTILLVVSSACSNNDNNPPVDTVTKIPPAIQKLTVPSGSSIRAWVTVDNNPRIEMQIDATTGTASVSIPALTQAVHNLLLEYEFSNATETLVIASVNRSVNLSAGSTTLNISNAEYATNFDEDQDGVSNITELANGTNPFGLPAFSANCFPLPVASESGALIFNYEGNLLIVDGSDSVRLMDNNTCNVTTLVTIPGASLANVVEDKIRDRLYASSTTTGTVYEINVNDRSSRVLIDTGVANAGLAMAPSSYEPYGGQLIIATMGGRVLVTDPSVTNQSLTTITILAASLSGVVFGNNGVLYVAAISDSKIVAVAADGTVRDFATGANIDVPVGLSIDNKGSRLLIMNRAQSNIVSASIPSGKTSILGSVNISAQGLPGIAYNGRNSLLTTSAALQVELRPARAFNTSCLLSFMPGGVPGLNIPGVPDSTASFTSFGADDLLFTTHSNDIRVLNRAGCSLKILASNVAAGAGLLGIIYDPVQDVIYVSDDKNSIYTVDPADGSSTLLATVAQEATGLAIAPASYVPYGGQLIAVLSDGRVVAIDPSKTPAIETSITEAVGVLSDLIFDTNGVLYIVSNSGGSVNTVSSTGVVTSLVTGLNAPDGLAIDVNTNRLFITNAGDDTLVQVNISDPTNIIVLSAADFRPASFSSGIFFDG